MPCLDFLDRKTIFLCVSSKEIATVFPESLEAVSDEDIEKILEVARWAPSGLNTQPWEFVVLNSKDSIEKLSEAIKFRSNDIKIGQMGNMARNMMKGDRKKPQIGLPNAPVFILVCGDNRRRVELPGQSYKMVNGKIKLGKGFMLDHDSIMTSCLANSFMLTTLAATSLGLATQYVTFTASEHALKNLQKSLGLPEYLMIYDCIALGYGAYTPPPKYMRELDTMVHYNGFDESKVMTDKEPDERAKTMANMKGLNFNT